MGVRKLKQGCRKPEYQSLLRRVFFAVGLAFFSAANGFAAEAPREIPERPAQAARGTLFICGGGDLPPELIAEFVELIGGKSGRLVVIPTANHKADVAPDEVLAMWQARMPGEVTLLHTHSPDVANRDEFLTPLREATGVWMIGGKQSRLTDAYLGTKLLQELHAFHARGGVIGGSSAGAAVMSDVMICGGTHEAPGIFEGFSLLRDAIVDQHFSQRKREPRLLVAMRQHPGRVGYGIDEGTALIVRGRDLRVAGAAGVNVYLPESPTKPVHKIRLAAGDHEDLQAMRRAAISRSWEPKPTAVAKAAVYTPRAAKGSLVIVGGGKTPDAAKQRFLDLAGGPDAKIAVVATAEEPTNDLTAVAWLKRAGAKNVVVFEPNTPDEANDPKLAEALAEAKGIWFGGGRQWRFIDAFEKTACYEAFCKVLERGGVIGGTSAGATIQGEYLVRGSPVTNEVMMAEGYDRGFGFLQGAAIDQHFSQRKRQPDMEQLKRSYPQLLGLGIDESTAVVVKGAQFEVIGDNTVSVYPPVPVDAAAAAPANETTNGSGDGTAAEPLVAAPQVLKPGDAYDLERFVVHGTQR